METTKEPREYSNPDLKRTVGLIGHNCKELLAVLESGTSSEQANHLATLLMHMGVGRGELLDQLKDILTKHPDVFPTSVREQWLKAK